MARSGMAPIPTFSSTTASTTASQLTQATVRSSPHGTPPCARVILGAWILVAPAADSERVVQVPVPADLPALVDPVVLEEVSVEAVQVQPLSRQSFSAATASSTT